MYRSYSLRRIGLHVLWILCCNNSQVILEADNHSFVDWKNKHLTSCIKHQALKYWSNLWALIHPYQRILTARFSKYPGTLTWFITSLFITTLWVPLQGYISAWLYICLKQFFSLVQTTSFKWLAVFCMSPLSRRYRDFPKSLIKPPCPKTCRLQSCDFLVSRIVRLPSGDQGQSPRAQ